MYIYIYICIYIYTYTCTHVYIHIPTHIYKRMLIYVYMYLNVFMFIYLSYIYTYIIPNFRKRVISQAMGQHMRASGMSREFFFYMRMYIIVCVRRFVYKILHVLIYFVTDMYISIRKHVI